MFHRHALSGTTFLELLLSVVIMAIFLLIVLALVHPTHFFAHARNAIRRADVTYIADGISAYAREEGPGILAIVPRTPSSVEICGDTRTGSCANLFNLQALVGSYLSDVPIDPDIDTEDGLPVSHSRYFIERLQESRFRISAPDAEGDDVVISAER